MVKAAFLVSILLLMVGLGRSRFFVEDSEISVSDGIDQVIELPTSTVTCEPSYGFLPCTTSLWGQLFLVVVYEYLLFLGESYISAGSELIFKNLGTGYFGASAFHILGALPEAVLVFVSGLSGSKETAQEQVVVGMGLLSGSTILLLTLLWATCVAVGNYDLSDPSTSPTLRQTRRLNFRGSGVKTDLQTSLTARIMLISLIPFIIVLVTKLFKSTSMVQVVVLVSLIVTIALLLSYCIYQVFSPAIQTRRLEYLMRKYLEANILEKLYTADGNPNTAVIKELFHKIDQNNDTYISPVELRSLVLGIQFEEIGLVKDDFVVEVMKEFDTTGDAHISESEFIKGISQWLLKARQSIENGSHHQRNFLKKPSQKNGEVQVALLDQQDKAVAVVKRAVWPFKAAFQLLLGTAILAILANPLIETVQNLSTAANIPTFFISFIVMPLAMNYREAVSAITSARQKKKNSASLTFSEIYSAAFMNNVVGLSIFLGLVYVRGLTWDFSAEVIVVILICGVVGLSGSCCTTFPLWTTIVAYLLYPLSLVFVYVLTYVFGLP